MLRTVTASFADTGIRTLLTPQTMDEMRNSIKNGFAPGCKPKHIIVADMGSCRHWPLLITAIGILLCALGFTRHAAAQDVQFPQWEGYDLLTAHDHIGTCHPEQNGMGSDTDGPDKGCCGTPGARSCSSGETTVFDGATLFQSNNCTIPDANSAIDLPYLLLSSGNCNLPLPQWDNPNATLPVSRPSTGINFTFYTASDTHFYRINFDVPDQAEFPYYLNQYATSGDTWDCSYQGCPIRNLPGNIDPPAAIIMPGDIANHGNEYYLGAYRLMWEKNWFPGGIQYPVFPGLGNHDISSITSGGWGNGDYDGAHRMFNYIRWKSHLFHQDRNGLGCLVNIDPGCADEGLNGGSLNYSWDWQGVHMVMLNTWGGDPNFTYTPAGGMNGLAWLARDLSYYVGTSNRPVILFQHYNIKKVGQVEWSATDYDNFWQVIKKYNVIGLFSGHLHYFDVESPWDSIATGAILPTDQPAPHHNLDNFSDGAVGACGESGCDQTTGSDNFLVARVTDHYLDVGAKSYAAGYGFYWDNFINFRGPYSSTGQTSQQYICRKRINSNYTYVDDSLASVSRDGNDNFVVTSKPAHTLAGAFALELTDAIDWDFVDSCDPAYSSTYALVTEKGLSPGENTVGGFSPATSAKLVLLNDGVNVTNNTVAIGASRVPVHATTTSGQSMKVTVTSDQSWVTGTVYGMLPGDIVLSLNGLPTSHKATITITPQDPYAIPATITVTPQTIPIAVSANHAAGTFYLNGVQTALPYQGTAYLGDQLTFKALGLVQLVGERLRFNHWVAPTGQTSSLVETTTLDLDSLKSPVRFGAVYDDQFQLTVGTNPGNLGHVRITPPARDQGGYYNQGTVITVRAIVPEGYFFTGFTSPVPALNVPISPLSFTIQQPTALTANFIPNPIIGPAEP